MKPVDYNTQQHENYVRGRSLRPDQVDFWIRAFADRLPRRRPLHGLDLGSGTGRFTPALAAAFGPVTGVEPAAAMRRIAGAAAHPGVSYLSGPAVVVATFQPLADVVAVFARAGWRVADFAEPIEPSAATRAETLAKLRLRPYSIFEHFTPEEAAVGFERLEAAVASDPDALVPSYQQPLLTLTRP